METVYYNYYAFEEAKASGGEDRHAALVRGRAPRRRTAGGNNVISLEDYRAKQAALAAAEPEEDQEFSCGGGAARPTPRSRGREWLLMGMELAACAAMIAVAAAACAAFLL